MDLKSALLAVAEGFSHGYEAVAPRGLVAVVVQANDEEAVLSVELSMAQATEAVAFRLADACGAHGRVIWSGVGAVARAERHELHGGCAAMVQVMPRSVPRVHVTHNIEQARRLSEQGVLTIGTEIQGVSTVARAHVAQLQNLSSQFSEHADDSIASNVNALSEGVRAVRFDLLERAERQVQGVARAQGWTQDIMRLGQSINEIAASARILTFNARVESARIGEQGKGFAVIAQSIQDLAAQIRAANQSVTALVQRLASSLPELHTEAQAIANTITHDTSRIEQQLGVVHHAVEAARLQSQVTVEESTASASDMQRRVESVLVALQFQDRASQLLAEAKAHSETLMRWAGVQEVSMVGTDAEQVGALGREVRGDITAEPGSVVLM